MERPLWQPGADRVASSNLARFIKAVEARWGTRLDSYAELHRWSVTESEKFWLSVWEECGVIAETRGNRVAVDRDRLPGARFFPDARLNFAENILRRRDDGTAMVFWGEDKVRRRFSHRALYDLVSRLQQALVAAGVGEGDRVAGFLPNMPETIAAMLAAASLGAIWSSCSPDFGIRGVMDRFGQIEPKVLFCADGYFYNGKTHDSLERARGIVAELPRLERLVVIPYVTDRPSLAGLGDRAVILSDFIGPYRPGDVTFKRLPFNHPLYIMYSSGTTGMPKCIVHGAGGTLLKHLQEHQHNCDIRPGDVVFYFTTCGWMMWNWLVSCLASGATILLYDGAPNHPSANILFDLADAEGMTHFGTSARFIDSLLKMGLRPKDTHKLVTVRTILSTGSPLAPAGFDYVYENIKANVCLSSMSGGTDIIGCFVGGNPMLPVWRGEIQSLALGMDVQVFDDQGKPVATGEKGELVCTNSFPSMPIGFWNDPGDQKYREAYFARFPNVWCHGDWVEMTPHGGMVIYGRSDAVLNPGGVRIGTAEIYRQVEQIPEILESLVVGQEWQNDVRVVLFVRLKDGLQMDEVLATRIRKQIRDNATPRHVPTKIIQVADIPRTINGKLVELAVRNVIHGRPVKNRDALANPQALDLYKDLPELRT